ncbi:unnamed protein product [Nippostrongylus brasiliensis]|uniref:Dehydrogenase/reductase SDR family member 13 (inferred by orthology to a human protein) n=1 Tax=Nippostrongylus brasiliensis TaxID=27835 RepID=A0A0N4XDE4_NIPBR|nr:unnamed protein product [Nippostrongylus brasiliensis]
MTIFKILWLYLYGSYSNTLKNYRLLSRKYIRGNRFEEDVRADGKIVAVTGANSGIEVHHLDILVCNAGVLRVPTFTKTEDGFEKTWQCNYLGHVLLTELLLPALANSTDGRILNVSSILYEFADSVSLNVVNDPNCYGGMMAYSRSKMAQVMYTKSLAKRMEKQNIPVTVTVCHPGNVDTNILRESGYHWVGRLFRPIMWFVLKTEDDGAQMPLFLALSRKLPKQSNGQYFRWLAFLLTQNSIIPN